MTSLSKDDLVFQLKKIYDFKSKIVNLKVSLRSIGHIDGGADTLIDALMECVGEEGTIVTDSFVRTYSIFSPKLYKSIADDESPSYAGALANAMIKRKDSLRSNHPVQKFCVIGKYSKELTSSHNRMSYAYQILQDISLMGGINLKIGSDSKVPGVGTTHVAIGNLGFRQLRLPTFVRYRDSFGSLKFFSVNWSGVCLCTLNKLVPYYEYNNCILAKGSLGNAPVKVTSMKQTLEIETELIASKPAEFLACSDSSRNVCSCTWEGIGSNPFRLFLVNLIQRRFRIAFRYLIVLLLYKYPFN